MPKRGTLQEFLRISQKAGLAPQHTLTIVESVYYRQSGVSTD
jgi:hypothetical protein